MKWIAGFIVIGLVVGACGVKDAIPWIGGPAIPITVAGTFRLKNPVNYTYMGSTVGDPDTVAVQSSSGWVSPRSADALGQPCRGTGGYSDIGPTTEVLITSDEGKILAKTELGTGSFFAKQDTPDAKGKPRWTNPAGCDFTFSLDVPPGSKFYQVSVGKRGKGTYTLDELKVPGAVALTLGD